MRWVVKRNEEHSPAFRLPNAQEVPLEDVSRNCVQRGASGSSINRTSGFAAGPGRSPRVASRPTESWRGKGPETEATRLRRPHRVGLVAAGGFEPPT
jgi:hypothetical protein